MDDLVLRRVHLPLVGTLFRWIAYKNVLFELRSLSCFDLRDMGITRYDIEAVARGECRRS